MVAFLFKMLVLQIADKVQQPLFIETSYNYASASSQNYSYGFTNSEFFAFIGNLDPVEYILVITVVAIIIGVELNVFERQIVGGTLVDIGVTLW